MLKNPIPKVTDQLQHRAIGIINGKFTPHGHEQLNRGFLIDNKDEKIETVVLGKALSLIKKHIDLKKSYYWIVYPKNKNTQNLHLQVAGIWDPYQLNDFPNDSSKTDFSKLLEELDLKDNYFSVRGELVFVNTQKKEIVITALPLYHIFALVCNALVMFKYGARNILITNPRDMDGFIKELSKYNFSIITGVNTLFNGLLNNSKFSNLDFNNLKVAFGGGMAVQDIVANKWKSVTGCPLVEGYGLTETSPVVTINPLDGTNKIGTIGLPIPQTDVKFIDDAGKEVPHGERGEICVYGPQVMEGYWQRESDTKEIIKDGWLHTGDIGVIDDDGFIKIVDRKKEMVLVSGFNVFPNEVEHVISSHPKVLEVGVIGVPDKKWGETGKLFVVLKKNKELPEEKIITHCIKNLAKFKIPSEIVYVSELPRNATGKVLKRTLKEITEKNV